MFAPSSIIRRILLVALTLPQAYLISSAADGKSLVAGTSIGGTSMDHISGMVALANGNTAVCGWTDSYDMTYEVPGHKKVIGGSVDAFVAIISADHKNVIALTFFGGAQDDRATCIGVDALGRIIIAGETESNELSMSSGVIGQVYSANIDGFVAIYNPTLTKLERSTYINGRDDEHPVAMAVDVAGSIYLCGWTTSSTAFPTTNGYDRSFNGGKDAFVMKIAPSLSIMQFSTYFGSENDEMFTALHLTLDGTIALTGWTNSLSYETYPRVNPLMWWLQSDRPYDWTYNGGSSDAVLTVFSQDGARLIVSTYFGGSGADFGKAVATDSRGKIILFGESSSTDLQLAGGLQGGLRGEVDVFIGVFVQQGRALEAATFFGGSGAERVVAIKAITDDLWMICGTTTSRDLQPVGAGSVGETSGGTDVLIAKLSLGQVQFASAIGWSADEKCSGMLIDPAGDVVIAGSTSSMRITLDSELSTRGTSDGIIFKWAFGNMNVTGPRGGEHVCVGQLINFNWNTVDMPDTEEFSVEVSQDKITWKAIATRVKARQFVWRPTSSDIEVAGVYARLRTNRGHVSEVPSLIFIEPQVTVSPLPQGIRACVGTEIKLSVMATGTDLRYAWRRNGVPLGLTSSDLHIEKASLANAGKYECLVTGGCGQAVLSSHVSINVELKPLILEQPRSTSVTLGAQADLRVRVSGSTDILWYRADKPEVVGTGPTLTFSVATVADAGMYYAEASSECGKDVSDTVMLTVDGVSSFETEALNPNHVRLFPNPASGTVTVSFTAVIDRVKIVDMLGRQVGDLHPVNVGSGMSTLDLSPLAPGKYMILIHSGEKIATQGVVVIVP